MNAVTIHILTFEIKYYSNLLLELFDFALSEFLEGLSILINLISNSILKEIKKLESSMFDLFENSGEIKINKSEVTNRIKQFLLEKVKRNWITLKQELLDAR